MAAIPRIIRKNLRPEAVLINVALLVMCAVCLLPVVWSISSSLKDRHELYQTVPTLIPKRPTLANYEWMLTRPDMSRLPLNMFNSFKVTLGSILVQCTTASMAGFAFARLNFRGRDLLFYSLIVLMFIPRAGGLMALYELMSFLRLRNSHLGLILLFPSAISVALFIMRQNFLGVPRELEDAARGAGRSAP